MSGTEVTARDPQSGQSDTVTIVDDYVLITDGRCHRAGVTVHNRSDGGTTHVITVKTDPPSAVAS